MDIGKVMVEARRRGAQAVELLKEAAFELSWDVRDAAKTGFGVPRLASSAASLGVATVAAAGAASVAFDFAGKIWGKKECATCNGWEGLRCQLCKGAGKVQYNIDETKLSEAERSSSQSVAAAALEGRAAIEYIAATIKLDLPFPYVDCPQCDGTGVMKCTTCQGNAWVPKFTIAKTMNAPWLAWDAYRKIETPREPPEGVEVDPAIAEFEMFTKDELRYGFKYDEEVKQAAMARYENAREYDIVRQAVARRDPGWETLQEVLFIKDPLRAAQDPLIVTNPPYYKAKMKILSEVRDLPVPPRPADWMNLKRPLSESDWSKEDLQDPRTRSEMKVLLEGQEEFFSKILDSSWENHWREQKFEETKREMIESYEREKDGHQKSPQPEAKQKVAGVGPRSPPVSRTKQAKPVVENKPDVRKRPEDDKKRRERQERSERMAKQAVEREAALSRAKAARESKDGR